MVGLTVTDPLVLPLGVKPVPVQRVALVDDQTSWAAPPLLIVPGFALRLAVGFGLVTLTAV